MTANKEQAKLKARNNLSRRMGKRWHESEKKSGGGGGGRAEGMRKQKKQTQSKITLRAEGRQWFSILLREVE
jgi:hypothetical protein